ncbi:MAG: hypothetical protein WBL27_01740 [Salinimicrobium sp.]
MKLFILACGAFFCSIAVVLLVQTWKSIRNTKEFLEKQQNSLKNKEALK